MIGLRSGLRLVGRAADEAAHRIHVSKGTTVAGRRKGGAMGYSEEALIPHGPWRPPSETEISALTAAPADAEGSIGVVPFPDGSLHGLRSLLQKIPRRRKYRQVLADLASPSVVSAMKDVASACGVYGQVIQGPHLRVNRPGLPTTTEEGLRLLGIHVDNWFHDPLPHRHRSPNRLCVNVGEEDRHLIVVNLSMRQMFLMLKADNSEVSHEMVGTPLARLFLRRFPDYSPLRLRVRPGEAYVAPTENMAHDGCTSEMRSWDFAVHFLGRFCIC